MLTASIHHQRGNPIINNGKIPQSDVIAQVNGKCLYILEQTEPANQITPLTGLATELLYKK